MILTTSFYDKNQKTLKKKKRGGISKISVDSNIYLWVTGFFSKFLMGGTKKVWSPRSPMGTKSDGGGGPCEKNLTEAETAHLMQN